MRNKEENREKEKYNSDIDRIIPLNIYDNKKKKLPETFFVMKKCLDNGERR